MALNTQVIKKWLWVAPCLLLIWLAFISLKYGSASLDYYRVKNIVEEWQNEGNQQTKRQYASAKSAVTRAVNKHPFNPLYIDTMGQILEWGALAGYEDNENVALMEAKGFYQQATHLRPTWPVTWASMAMIKWRLQEFDTEMQFYLSQADKYGPMKPEVHILFVNLGFALYKHNQPMLLDIRQTFMNRIALGLRNPSTRFATLQQIQQSGVGSLICRWLKDEPDETLNFIKGCRVSAAEKS
ncbi:MAG: exopolysaccharide biosynthesis protein VpsP [Aliiglaciecola sp.]